MQDGEKLSLGQIQEFLDASRNLQFEGQERGQIYEWVTSILRHGRKPEVSHGVGNGAICT